MGTKKDRKGIIIYNIQIGGSLQIGDIMMKREMANKNRKGGKLDNTVSDQMYVVENFMRNGNIVLQNMDTNELEKKSVPRDQLKKFDIDEEMKSKTTTTPMTEAIDDMTIVKTNGSNAAMTSNLKTNTKNDPITNTQGNANDEKSQTKNAMDYMIVDTQEISSITEVHKETVITSDEEDSFFPDLKPITSTPISPKKMEVEYNYVMVTHLSVRNNFTFKPLTARSREEIGPRLLITQLNDIPFKGIGQPLCGPSNNIHYIRGDGNCYFRAISFYISGQEEYQKEVREMICDYIKFFPG